MAKLTPAAYALSRGVSLREMSEVSGKGRNTLNHYHKTEKGLLMFDAIIDATLYRRQEAAKAANQ